jgi:hypothetical protein
MKQTFEIPQGCTRVTIEQHDNQIIITFKPEARFKDGDILDCGILSNYIIIYKDSFYKGDYLHANYYAMIFVNEDSEPVFSNYCTLVSPKLSNYLLPLVQSKLAKVGKAWNAEKKCIEDLKPKRWRAEKGNGYFILNTTFESNRSIEDNCEIDDERYNAGNYFQTEQQAEYFAERIKQLPR